MDTLTPVVIVIEIRVCARVGRMARAGQVADAPNIGEDRCRAINAEYSSERLAEGSLREGV